MVQYTRIASAAASTARGYVDRALTKQQSYSCKLDRSHKDRAVVSYPRACPTSWEREADICKEDTWRETLNGFLANFDPDRRQCVFVSISLSSKSQR